MKTISSLILPARLENLPKFIGSAVNAARTGGMDEKRIADIELVVEELIVNIISHAYEGGEGEIEMVCGWDGAKGFVLEISDKGRPFDVTRAQPPDMADDVERRKIGGLGVHFMTTLMDEIVYRRDGERNVLELSVHSR